MSADFWAGYISGAAGIIIGNPLDVLKVRLQAFGTNAGTSSFVSPVTPTQPAASGQSDPALGNRAGVRQWLDLRKLSRGITPPLLTYGPLNALLFVSYNRTLCLLDPSVTDPSSPPSTTSLSAIWLAGALGGFATWIVSAPTESVKCRAQATSTFASSSQGSLSIARAMWKQGGLRQLYMGGGITSARDAVGYGFYFWSYELLKRTWTPNNPSDSHEQALRVLVCGGIAGVVTWASIFPLDVVKTRYQIQDLGRTGSPESRALLVDEARGEVRRRSGAWQIAKEAYRQEGVAVFFRGLGVCSARAFVVNAVQWMVYEWTLQALRPD